MAKIDEFRSQYPEYNDLDDETLAQKLHAKEYSDLPYEEFRAKFIGPREVKPQRSFLKDVADFAMSIPTELGKDLAAPFRLPADLINSLGAQSQLESLPEMDYNELRARGLSHEQASSVMQAYINELSNRSAALQQQAAGGQERATRTAAAAASTLAGGGAGALAGKAGIAGLKALALTGAAAGGTHGGVTAAGQGGGLGDIAGATATGAAAGGVLGPAIPVAGKFLIKEFTPLVTTIGRLLPGRAGAAARVAQEALAGENPQHPAVARLTAALKEAAPVSKEQAEVLSRERAKRFEKFSQRGTEVAGEAGAHEQMRSLAGEVRRVDFESLRGKIQQGDVDALFDIIRQHPALSPGETVRSYVALGKLLGEGGGKVPQANEIELLNAVFGKDFTKTLLGKRGMMARAKQLGIELVNIPRSLMASMDLSAPFRQGAFLVGRPAQFLPAFGEMFKYLGSQRALDALNANIEQRATAPLMRQARLAITEMGGGILDRREEAFLSNIAEKIPVLGAGVRASQRAYIGFLNKLRADTFDDILLNAQRHGVTIDGQFLSSLGDFINSATGRGRLPTQGLERAAPALSTVLFSPRLMASRINLLNPVYYAKLDPFVRKEAIKSAMTAGALGVSVLGLMKAAGAQVETDPRSSDFGKARLGDTRFDIFAGFQQYVRLGAQLLPNFGTDLPVGAVKSPMTGRVRPYGRGFNAPTRLKQVSDFMENKLAPVPGLMVDLFRGRQRFPENAPIKDVQALMEGETPVRTRKPARKIDPWAVSQDLVTPLVVRDAIDAMVEWGPETGAYMAVPAMFGTGVQTIPSPRANPSPVPESLLDRVLTKQKREKEKPSGKPF